MQNASLQGSSILVVEDEPLISLDIELAFAGTGAKLTSTSTLPEATLLVELAGLSAAIIDHGLCRDTSTVLYERLNRRGIPFLIYTAHSLTEIECKTGVLITKPALPEVLVFAMEECLRVRRSKQRRA
jgi:DNA-binding response OmpR family regulator